MGSASRSKRTTKRKYVAIKDKVKKPLKVPSASEVKLGNVNDVKASDDHLGGQSFIVELDCLNNLFSSLSCPQCKVGRFLISMDTSKKMGCCVILNLTCSNCESVIGSCATSKRNGQYFEVNRRLAYAMKQIGGGHREAEQFMTVMNMPPPPNQAPYNKHIKALLNVVQPLANEAMRLAAHRVRGLHDSGECGVSVDGSWHRRGYSSLNGVVTALSIDTGEVLDVEVMTKHCAGCKKWSRKDKSSIEYANWIASHQCSINFNGSSTLMESVGAGRIFERSVMVRGLQYVDFYGDGDSKSHAAVCLLDPYGKEIRKKECIGHYQKRLGTALRKLKKSVKGIGGKGKLTDAKINIMQNYFGLALRNNTESVEKMSRAIWSTFFHLSARDDHPLHSKCPAGSESWCSYQRAVAQGKADSYKHKGGLPLELLKHIKPTYERLTDPEMLEKCLHGKTQNNNECLHSLIWKRSPKTKFAGVDSVKLSVFDAVLHFNLGSKPELEVLRRMGIKPGLFMMEGVKMKDETRISESLRQSTPSQKQRRKLIRGAKKRKEDESVQKEGVTYAAGGF